MKKLARAQVIYVLLLFLCVAGFFALVEMAVAEEFGVVFWVGVVALPAAGIALAFYCCDRFRCPNCRRIMGTVFRRWGVHYCPGCGVSLDGAPGAEAASGGPHPAVDGEQEGDPAADGVGSPASRPARGAGHDLLRVFAIPLLLMLGLVLILHTREALGPYGQYIRGMAAGVGAFWGSMILCAMAFSKRVKCPSCGRASSDLHGDVQKIVHCPYCGSRVPRQDGRNQPGPVA